MEEIQQRRFYRDEERVDIVIKGSDWFGIEGLSRIVLLHALAQSDIESSIQFEKDNEIRVNIEHGMPFDCMLDGVQFVQIQ